MTQPHRDHPHAGQRGQPPSCLIRGAPHEGHRGGPLIARLPIEIGGEPRSIAGYGSSVRVRRSLRTGRSIGSAIHCLHGGSEYQWHNTPTSSGTTRRVDRRRARRLRSGCRVVRRYDRPPEGPEVRKRRRWLWPYAE